MKFKIHCLAIYLMVLTGLSAAESETNNKLQFFEEFRRVQYDETKIDGIDFFIQSTKSPSDELLLLIVNNSRKHIMHFTFDLMVSDKIIYKEHSRLVSAKNAYTVALRIRLERPIQTGPGGGKWPDEVSLKILGYTLK